jgi:hypothetical protein
MASRLGLRLAPAACRASFGVPAPSQSFSSLAQRRAPSVFLRPQATLRQRGLQQSFRRGYAQAPQVVLSPTPKPKKRFRFFRWIWRITYLSALSGVAFLTYQIWDLRNPREQFEPDPSKKTLVVLGTSRACLVKKLTDTCRNRLGLDLSSQEAGHRELQCHRYLSTQLLPVHPSSSFLHRRYHRASIDHGTYP